MSQIPPMGELEFLKRVRNHGENRRLLVDLAVGANTDSFDDYVSHVSKCWFTLAEDHLREAAASVRANLSRAAYSRSYYAAYNASKAVRYRTKGSVSLKGDDHQSAPDLPDAFPEASKWGSAITSLYEHRLHADYDNWNSSPAQYTMSPRDALHKARDFVSTAKEYLNSKHGMKL